MTTLLFSAFVISKKDHVKIRATQVVMKVINLDPETSKSEIGNVSILKNFDDHFCEGNQKANSLFSRTTGLSVLIRLLNTKFKATIWWSKFLIDCNRMLFQQPERIIL